MFMFQTERGYAMAEKQIVRFLGNDLDGNRKLSSTFIRIKGVSHNLSSAILKAVGVDKNKKIGELSEKEIEKLEDAAKNPIKYGIPSYMVNRQKSYKTGEDEHLLGNDIKLQIREDVNRLRKIRAYRGIRHERNLPVRGQRTRSSFRHGAAVGVSKKKK